MNEEKVKDWLIVNGDLISIADYKKIRDDLLEDYKYIFKLVKKEVVNGVETTIPLDIPEYSADYIYNNNLGLIIWNLLTKLKDVYKQHNIQFAKGKYLDKLLGLYNQTRQKQRKYVVQIAVTNVGDIDSLIDQEVSSTNGYTFKISSFVKTTGTASKPLEQIHYYYMDAIDYYENLQPSQIANLELLWVGELLGEFINSPLLILTQRREESDQSFLSRINLHSEYSALVNELEKINDIENVIIITSDMVNDIFNPSNSPKLKPNEIIILIQFREDFYYQNEEVRNSITIDVKVTIQEFSPLGVVGKSIGNVNEWQLSSNSIPFTDFISRTINYYYKVMQRAAVKCTVSQVYSDTLDDDIQDLLRDWESQDIFTPYELNQSGGTGALINNNKFKSLIEKYLRVSTSSINSQLLVSNSPILTEAQVDSTLVKTTNSAGEITSLTIDLSRLPSSVESSITSTKFKPTISKYKYWRRPDGDYEIIFY